MTISDLIVGIVIPPFLGLLIFDFLYRNDLPPFELKVTPSPPRSGKKSIADLVWREYGEILRNFRPPGYRPDPGVRNALPSMMPQEWDYLIERYGGPGHC